MYLTTAVHLPVRHTNFSYDMTIQIVGTACRVDWICIPKSCIFNGLLSLLVALMLERGRVFWYISIGVVLPFPSHGFSTDLSFCWRLYTLLCIIPRLTILFSASMRCGREPLRTERPNSHFSYTIWLRYALLSRPFCTWPSLFVPSFCAYIAQPESRTWPIGGARSWDLAVFSPVRLSFRVSAVHSLLIQRLWARVYWRGSSYETLHKITPIQT